MRIYVAKREYLMINNNKTKQIVSENRFNKFFFLNRTNRVKVCLYEIFVQSSFNVFLNYSFRRCTNVILKEKLKKKKENFK